MRLLVTEVISLEVNWYYIKVYSTRTWMHVEFQWMIKAGQGMQAPYVFLLIRFRYLSKGDCMYLWSASWPLSRPQITFSTVDLPHAPISLCVVCTVSIIGWVSVTRNLVYVVMRQTFQRSPEESLIIWCPFHINYHSLKQPSDVNMMWFLSIDNISAVADPSFVM